MLVSNLERVASCLEFAAQNLPKDMELYDFGGGIEVAPVPDIRGNDGYLTSHMAAVARKRAKKEDPVIITGFGFDLQFTSPAELQRGMEIAAEKNRTQTIPYVLLTQKETQQ